MENTFISSAQIIIHEAREHSHLEADSEDSVIYLDNAGKLLIGVFDGCGGSGAERYSMLGNRTGAQIGAITAAVSISDAFDRLIEMENSVWSAEEMADYFSQKAYRELSSLSMMISGTRNIVSHLKKTFPTTAVLMFCEEAPENSYRVCSFWGGDSRSYILTPDGLKQSSVDDVKGLSDPFLTMENDDVLSRVLHADKLVPLHADERYIKSPCILICASDGCYSGLQSPMFMEAVLLETMMQANSPNEWTELLKDYFGRTATDDYTMAIAILGFTTFEEMKQSYFAHFEEFCSEYVIPVEAALANNDRDTHKSLWEKYKQNYMGD